MIRALIVIVFCVLGIVAAIAVAIGPIDLPPREFMADCVKSRPNDAEAPYNCRRLWHYTR